MKIEFLKDHLEHKEGDKLDNHPNASYLVTLKVAKEVKDKPKETGKKK